MIEPLDEMQVGTFGFRATGRVSRDEYRDVLLPRMKEAAEAGDVRLVFVIGPDFERFEAGALAEDTKVGITLGIGHHHAWKRTAIVTDVDWITNTIHLMGWMTPGEVMVTGLDDLDAAKAWVAG